MRTCAKATEFTCTFSSTCNTESTIKGGWQVQKYSRGEKSNCYFSHVKCFASHVLLTIVLLIRISSLYSKNKCTVHTYTQSYIHKHTQTHTYAHISLFPPNFSLSLLSTTCSSFWPCNNMDAKTFTQLSLLGRDFTFTHCTSYLHELQEGIYKDGKYVGMIAGNASIHHQKRRFVI